MMSNNLEAGFSELIELGKQAEELPQDNFDSKVDSSVFPHKTAEKLLVDLRSKYKENKEWFEKRLELIQTAKKQVYHLYLFVQLSQLVELGKQAEVAMEQVKTASQDIQFDEASHLNDDYLGEDEILLNNLRSLYEDFNEWFSHERRELIDNAKEQILPWKRWLRLRGRREAEDHRNKMRRDKNEFERKKNKYGITDWDFD
jgi:hypothetical protein